MIIILAFYYNSNSSIRVLIVSIRVLIVSIRVFIALLEC